ncbi:glycosyltransferase family 9 protein [candidate division FCPU426 bacterium]|nr:glycosyltransferase family 9 protein [candidate division FCPU426 bacterium]
MKPTHIPRGTRRYVYRWWLKRWAAGLLDFLGTAVMLLFTGGKGLTVDRKILAQPGRILVVRLDHIGDVLFARPALHTLRRMFPRAHITALVSTDGRALLSADREVDEILTWDAPWFSRAGAKPPALGFWQMARVLKKHCFDLSLDLRGDLRHHLLCALAGIPLRSGYGITGGAFLLHLPLQLRAGVHEVERNLDLVRVLGEGPTPGGYVPLPLDAQERAAGEKVWAEAGSRIVIHPTAGDPRKQWGAGYYAGVCDLLTAKGCTVVLVGAAVEKGAAQQVARLCLRPVRVLAGQTSLRELTAVITAADLFIGNDSGPGHIAITQGKPVIMIWSETNAPEEWGPWGDSVRACVIRHPRREEAVAEVAAAAQRFLQKKS